MFFAGCLQRVLDCRGRGNLVTEALQQLSHDLQCFLVVLHQQYPRPRSLRFTGLRDWPKLSLRHLSDDGQAHREGGARIATCAVSRHRAAVRFCNRLGNRQS